MPDRIVRDELLESDRWLELARNTHRLAFIVLLLRVDGLGNLEAGLPRLCRLWACLGGCTREQAIETLQALTDADLIRLYDVDKKRYLHIPRFRQRLRSLRRIAPLSPWTTDHQKQLLAKNMSDTWLTDVGHLLPEVKRSEVKRSEEKRKSQRLVAATQLPADWQLPEEWKTWAVEAHHLDPKQAFGISLAFRDYWHSKAKDNTKRDWFATWRNWIRKETHSV